MKKTLSFALCLVMLVSCFSFLVGAKEVVLYDVKTSAENGTITVSTDKAEEGTLVFVEVKAADGYYFVEGSLKYGHDDGVKITKDTAGNYCFKMPHDDITVTASFKKNPSTFETLWNSIKPVGTSILNVLKSFLPLIKVLFNDIVSAFKAIFSAVKG